MKKQADVTELINSIQNDLKIDTAMLSEQQIRYEELRSFLSEKIDHLLKNNKPLLYASLYRIDVAEKDVRKAMGEKDSALLLAELILRKLNDKIYWRNLYKNK
jgi:hypothetical protein